MKKISTLILFSLFYLISSAQHCSITSNSISAIPATVPGIQPSYFDLPCIQAGQPVNDTLYFYKLDSLEGSFTTNLGPVTIKFDSINNLPAGLCWSTNKANNTFGSNEDGVILIQGITSASPGQYKLRIIVDATIPVTGLLQLQPAEQLFGLRYYLRVACSNGGCNDIDTTLGKTNYFLADTVCAGHLFATITPSGSSDICSGSSVDLTANIGPGYRYLWSTGETTRTIQAATAADYTVTVYNATDSAVSSPLTVTVNQSPYAHFYMQPDTAPHVWHVMNQCYGNNLTYIWDWGDGNYDYTDTATHVYADSGYYTICVTVQDLAGCSGNYCDTNVYLYKTANQVITANIVRAPNTGISDVQTKVLDIKYYGNAIHFTEPIKNASTIKLYDLSGRVVMEKERFTGSSLDVSTDLAHGIYVLRAENEQYSITKKILTAQ